MEQVRLVLDCWESQSYWPLTGWSAPVGQVHYWVPALNLCCDFLPENLSCPSNWEWSDSWTVDRSMTFGQPDEEGWYYGLTFDRLTEALKQKRATGLSSKMLVRSRRHLRPLYSSYEVVVSLINHHKDKAMKAKAMLEACIAEKVRSLSCLDSYDDNRQQLQKETLAAAVEGFQNIIAFLCDLASDLKALSQILAEYASIELDHASKLSALGARYAKGKSSPYVYAARAEALPVKVVTPAMADHSIPSGARNATHTPHKTVDDRSNTTQTMSTPTSSSSSTTPTITTPRPASHRFFSSFGLGGSLVMSSSKALMQSFQSGASNHHHSTPTSHGDHVAAYNNHGDIPHVQSTDINPSPSSMESSEYREHTTDDDASMISSSCTTIHSSADIDPSHPVNSASDKLSTMDDKGPQAVTTVDSSDATTRTQAAATPTSSISTLFFAQLSLVAGQLADKIRHFSGILHRGSEGNDLHTLVQQIHAVIEEAKINLQRNRDLFRLCEMTSKQRFDQAVTVHKTTIYRLLSIIARLDEELSVLQGGLTTMYSSASSQNAINRNVIYSSSSNTIITLEMISYNATTFTGTLLFETSIGVEQTHHNHDLSSEQAHRHDDHQDVWLCMHQYKEAVRDSQEALSILIADYMDVEFHQQILSNKAYNVFSELSSLYVTEQLSCWRDLSSIFDNVMHKQMLGGISHLRIPYPDLDSPFTKINFSEMLAENCSDYGVLSSSTAPSSAATATTVVNGYNINYDHCIQQCGLFSFTQLYNIAPPKTACIACSGRISISKGKMVNGKKAVDTTLLWSVDNAIWKEAFALVTMDGCLHVLTEKQEMHELPALSYYIKNYELQPIFVGPDSSDPSTTTSLSALILHIVPRAGVSSKNSGIDLCQELYIRCESEIQCKRWKAALTDPISLVDVDVNDGGISAFYSDGDIEAEVRKAMLNSLCILRGQTNAVSASLLKYQDRGSLLSVLNSSYRTTVKKNLEEDTARFIYDDDDDSGGGDDGDHDINDDNMLDAASTSEDASTIDATSSDSADHVTAKRRKSISVAMDGLSASDAIAENGLIDIVPSISNSTDGQISLSSSKNSIELTASPPHSFGADDSASLSKLSKKDASWIKRKSVLLKDSSLLMVEEHHPDHKTDATLDNTALGSSPSPSNVVPNAVSIKTTKALMSRPKQLIPAIDRSVPLALKHSNMIDQYEQGLKAEKEKITLRVQATRNDKLKEAVMAVGNDHQSTVASTGDTTSAATTSVSNTSKKTKKVLSMTSLFEEGSG